MGVFDRQTATASRLITKYGQIVTWNQLSDGAPTDLDKPWKPGGVVTTPQTATIVFLPDTKENKQLLRYLAGSLTLTGTLTGLMAQVDFTPKPKDIVIRDGTQLVIKSIDILDPNGEGVILYFLEFEQ